MRYENLRIARETIALAVEDALRELEAKPIGLSMAERLLDLAGRTRDPLVKESAELYALRIVIKELDPPNNILRGTHGRTT